MSFATVIKTFKNQAQSWVDRYGDVLKVIAIKGLEGIQKTISDYNEKIDESPQTIDELKALLNQIAEVKTVSMMMEFKIADVVEKFRTLQMYNQPVEAEKVAEAFGLEKLWEDLVVKASGKDADLKSSKELFAKETEEDVAEFKKGLVVLYQQYKAEGPSSPQTDLDDGLRLIEYYKERTLELNKRKEELVLAEKLFNLSISSFPELVNIDE